MKKAEYERRVVAYLIDTILCFILVTIEYTLIDIFKGSLMYERILFLHFLNMIIYLSICYTIFRGHTIGGLFMNIKVVNNNGQAMMKRVGILRALLLSLLMLIIYNCFYMLIKRTQISFFDECTNTTTIPIRKPFID